LNLYGLVSFGHWNYLVLTAQGLVIFPAQPTSQIVDPTARLHAQCLGRPLLGSASISTLSFVIARAGDGLGKIIALAIPGAICQEFLGHVADNSV